MQRRFSYSQASVECPKILKDWVASSPAFPQSFQGPPGCSVMQRDTSYTFFSITSQQSSLLVCLWISCQSQIPAIRQCYESLKMIIESHSNHSFRSPIQRSYIFSIATSEWIVRLNASVASLPACPKIIHRPPGCFIINYDTSYTRFSITSQQLPTSVCFCISDQSQVSTIINIIIAKSSEEQGGSILPLALGGIGFEYYNILTAIFDDVLYCFEIPDLKGAASAHDLCHFLYQHAHLHICLEVYQHRLVGPSLHGYLLHRKGQLIADQHIQDNRIFTLNANHFHIDAPVRQLMVHFLLELLSQLGGVLHNNLKQMLSKKPAHSCCDHCDDAFLGTAAQFVCEFNSICHPVEDYHFQLHLNIVLAAYHLTELEGLCLQAHCDH